MNKKIKTIIILVILAAIAGAVYVYISKPKPFVVDKKELVASKVPSGFPDGFPIEGGSKTLQNYEASSKDGRKQYTRVMTSGKSIEDSVRFYRQYFANMGWSEIETRTISGGTTFSSLSFEKKMVNIVGRADDELKQNTISITISE
jgi:hypothetical protein